MYGFVLWSSASICVCSAKSFVHPGRETWGWYYQALINLTAEDNLEYLIFGSNWRSDVWIFYVVATGYHPRRKCCSLWSTHVNIPLMVSTQINVFNEAVEVEETLAIDSRLPCLFVWFFIQLYPFFFGQLLTTAANENNYLPICRNPLHLEPCTLHLVPCTLHLVPCTLHLAPCTLHQMAWVHAELV